MKHIVALIALLLVAATPAVAAASTGSGDVWPRHAASMRSAQVYGMYRNKTWLWRDGAAYFARNGRFQAWSQKGKVAYYADGRWWASRSHGRMCFQAVWRSRKIAAAKTNCFDHRSLGYVIYQRRVPAGQWYKFRNWPIDAGDEFHKLRAGNLVIGNFNRLRARFAKRVAL